MQANAMIRAKPPLAGVIGLLGRARLPIEDLTESHCEHFYFSGPANSPTGLVGLELYGDVALLRSLVVDEKNRGQGTGGALLKHAEAQARARGVRQLFLLTTTAEKFFVAHGYARVVREAAPPAIRATREFAGICPSSSAFMMRQL
jgi:amino-acid N-acetyltransferase